MITVEIYSDRCRIPDKFRLYHGGKSIDGFLRVREGSIYSSISDHVFLSANMGHIQESYLKDFLIGNPKFNQDKNLDEYRKKKLFVIDARYLLSNSYVMTNFIGVWYDELRSIDGLIKSMEKQNTDNLSRLIEEFPDYLSNTYLSSYLEKFPKLETKEDFNRRLKETKKEWFLKYCKVFNILHMERYAKQEDNIILAPGPIPVKNL